MMKPIYDPGFMLMAEMDGTQVGVRIGIPNWNPLLRKFQGKDGLWQQMQYFLRGRRNVDGGLVFAAMLPEYRGMGISPILGAKICERYRELGAKRVSSIIINECNQKSRHAVESIGGVGRILYYAYDKDILSSL